jgi:hypothetical protein
VDAPLVRRHPLEQKSLLLAGTAAQVLACKRKAAWIIAGAAGQWMACCRCTGEMYLGSTGGGSAGTGWLLDLRTERRGHGVVSDVDAERITTSGP